MVWTLLNPSGKLSSSCTHSSSSGFVGDDFSPLPVKTCRAYGLSLLSLQSHANATLVERPPAPGLGDAVKLFVMYMNRINASMDITFTKYEFYT
ncbi:hypothetical protein E2562_002956 [Oryza meyeriana var. granulata]|uniref:Uncharacterized protein n=1 Tax=Oryza meyeriana var. granulata TaxID=110450 RepID=A0A6G1DCI0_9ORYZ|nr:hypothetical protein E2562_002956 [Oryza meyeriana var. granulata]